MPLSNQRIADLISLMQKTYPGWTNFSDSSYIKDEVGYKRDAIAKIHKLLSETELSLLLDEGKFDEIISRLKSIGHTTNLLYTAVPSSGDLAILEDDKLDKQAFSRQIIQLLYGLSPSQDRLDDFLNYVRDNGLPNRWTFPTYFLFMCHPDTEMFIKPTATKAFFEYLSVEDLGFSSTPSGESYAKIKQLSHQLKDELEEYEPHDMVDIQSLIFVFYDKVKKDVMKPEKHSEFLNLFREFVSAYLLLPEGEKHSAYYEKGREQARKNLEDIKGALGRGEDIAVLTDQILSKLLPYSDTASNRDQGYWISIAPAFSGDLRIKFEAAGWRKDGWTEVANMVLNFVRRCDEHPDQLSEACTEFSESPYSRGLQTGTLTPILNALRPDKFVLINNKSRRVLNYFTDKSYTQSLIEYPKSNSTALSLIENVKEDLQILSKKNLLAVDLFDEFSHWLIAIKHHPLGSTGYWKIAPGENAWNWDASREGGFIALGWEEVGDISNFSRSQFNARRDELLKKYPDWKKIGVEQVWKFAHIKEGDRIIANRGTTEVLGIGSITGPYYFVDGVRHGHRIPVEWEDITPRRINKPGWKRTLIELTQEEFDEIYNSSEPTDIHIYEILKDRDEAEWAFALLKETLNHLGIKEPNDERFAITCPSGGKALHLNFGQWLILGFSSPAVGPNRIEITFPANQATLHNEFESFDFANSPDELNIKLYKLPLELVKPLSGDLRIAYEKALEHVADKFGDWKATPWRKSHHVQEIGEALFDENKLEDLLNRNFQRSVWWVNQGDSIKSEREDGVLCAPSKADSDRLIPHWERLVEIRPKDIILHYANGKLLYVSLATASAVSANRPYGKFDKVNLVKVDYYDLFPPIPLTRFSEELQELAIKDGPLNVLGGVKEGYLWRLNPEALKIIQNSQPETKWPEFAIPSGKSSWIFQANPKIFDIEGAIAELTEMNWKVNRYRDRIHAGDTVYIWEAGGDAGIVAVGKILSNPALIEDSESEKKFYRPDAAKENQEEQYIGVHISIEELETRIKRRNLLNHPAVSSMQILMHPQGTNFILTDKESKVLEDLIHPSKPKNPEYPLELCSAETGFDESTLARWIRAIERKGQAIVYGPPGTGKTFVAEHIAKHLIGGGDGFKEIIQFHPAYSYEDFVQGIRPKSRDDGNLEYSLIPGRFLDFCRRARGCNDTCVLIIDEINRANLARVFGELMYLLEYRGKEIPLAAGENHFSIPENIRIIGTMNTADRSIALVDHALRRRFALLPLQPEYNTLRLYHERKGTGFPIDRLIQVLMSLNEEIRDPHYEIGISYFMNEDLETQIEDIWKMEIEPYLEEYFFHDTDKLRNYRWDSVKSRLNP